jgi:DNA polymerase I-like protein with 3'-5' exonuclease and polymerase domains
MNLITIDFESYYSGELGFKKQTTEEYVRDDRFEVIGVAVKVNEEPARWCSGNYDETRNWLYQFDWVNSLVLAHNTKFDGAILNWLFKIKPKGWLDTLCMARAIHGVEAGGSLAKLTEQYKIGAKGTEVLDALNKRRVDFSIEQLAKYGEYCVNDAELTHKLFTIFMADGFPKSELKVIDITLNMFIDPILMLDLPLLEQHLEEVKAKKERLLDACLADKDTLMSNDKFAELLRKLGVEPPTKISARTGKEAWAFAKTDEEFKELASNPDVRVQTLIAARLGNKTTLEETRTQRFIDIAKRGALPVPIKYYAAHTGRWGGDDKINLQNLPSRGDNANKLKKAILAPEGYVVIDSDSSQIEARIVAWLAGQSDLVQAFENKEDVYKIMASSIYNKPVADITASERFVGKTTILGCFGADTKVLTNYGWKRIVEVKTTDMVWDGEEWVTHQGVVPKGLREVVTAYGIDATPEHEILTGHGWREWSEVTTNHFLFQSALRKANSPLSDGNSTSSQPDAPQDGTPLCGVHVGGKPLLTAITLKQKELHDVIPALKGRATEHVKSIGGTKILFRIWNTANDCLTALQVALHGVIQPLAKHTYIMAVGGLPFTNRGVQTEKNFYATLLPLKDGRSQPETLTASTTTGGMNRATYVSQHGLKMQVTNVQQGQCKKKLMTYDIAYAGSRNRFTIATDVGNLIVHNCGYGMGAGKFQAQLKTFGVGIELDECQRIISKYRQTYGKIPELWEQAQKCLVSINTNRYADLGIKGVLEFSAEHKGFKLPNGLWQRYESLYKTINEKGYDQYQYKTRKGIVYLYGGKLVENICQALARCVIAEQMVKIGNKYKVVLTVHDAVACVVPESEAVQAREYIEECMRWRPKWAQTLPLNCESGVGKSYGEC